MIHDEICTYEVAKLAKEKGFNEYEACSHLYEVDERWYTLTKYNNARGIDWSKSYFYAAPTQSLLQRWLREEKGIHIAVFPSMSNSFEFDYIVYIKGDKFWNPIYTALSDFDAYGLTLEDALKYALKNLV